MTERSPDPSWTLGWGRWEEETRQIIRSDLPDAAEAPALSVVIVTPDGFRTIANVVSTLRAQRMRERLEILIVAPSAAQLELDAPALDGFYRVQIIEEGEIISTARARAAGVRRASAPIVVLVEDHSFPEPGWAEALIEAHAQPWAAVGPAIGNANPATALSWANLLIEYLPWLVPAQGGVVDHLPGHNSSYKRDILLAYGSELEAMLEAESVLHGELRSRGYQLWLEPAARTNHLNVSSPLASLGLRFHGGRVFAAVRARRWSRHRRLAYALGGPLIPLVRFKRILGRVRDVDGLAQRWARVLPAVAVGLCVDGAGEAVGYVLGAGNSPRSLADLEFRRYRFLSKTDRIAASARTNGSDPALAGFGP
jgi:hypothetical protein